MFQNYFRRFDSRGSGREEDAEEEDSEWSGDEGGEGARRRGRERAPEPKRRRRQTLSAAGKKQKGALLPHVVSMQGPARAHKGGNKRGFQPSFTDQQFEVFGERKNILSMVSARLDSVLPPGTRPMWVSWWRTYFDMLFGFGRARPLCHLLR